MRAMVITVALLGCATSTHAPTHAPTQTGPLQVGPVDVPNGARYARLTTIDKTPYLAADVEVQSGIWDGPRRTTTNIHANVPGCIELPDESHSLSLVTSAHEVAVSFPDACD